MKHVQVDSIHFDSQNTIAHQIKQQIMFY